MKAKTNTKRTQNPPWLVLMCAALRCGGLSKAAWAAGSALTRRRPGPARLLVSACPRQTQGHPNVPGRTEASLCLALQGW